MKKLHIPDWMWKVAAFVLAGAFAVTFTLQQVRGSHVEHTTNTAAHTIQAETEYLRDVALYANYLAKTNHVICVAFKLKCPPSPHFPDPPGLPALGLK